jgi:hypothetical protein
MPSTMTPVTAEDVSWLAPRHSHSTVAPCSCTPHRWARRGSTTSPRTIAWSAFAFRPCTTVVWSRRSKWEARGRSIGRRRSNGAHWGAATGHQDMPSAPSSCRVYARGESAAPCPACPRPARRNCPPCRVVGRHALFGRPTALTGLPRQPSPDRCRPESLSRLHPLPRCPLALRHPSLMALFVRSGPPARAVAWCWEGTSRGRGRTRGYGKR